MTVKKLSWIVCIITVLAAAGCSGMGGSEADRLKAEGMKCHREGDLDCAMDNYLAALELEETAEAWNLLGMVYRFKYQETMAGKWRKKEIEAFEKAIGIDGEYVVAIKNLGVTFYQSGEKEKAAGLFERALELNPYDPEKDELERMIAEGKAQ